MNTPPEYPEYVGLTELFRHVSALRLQLGLPPLALPESMLGTLRSKNVPFLQQKKRNKKYHLETALRALTQKNQHIQPFNRTGTAEEISSREFIPMSDAVKMFRCSCQRFFSAIRNLTLKAFRHPHTHRIWVSIRGAERVAFYRRKRFIYSILPKKEADAIVAFRPFIPIKTCWGRTYNVYFCPEISHMGSVNTAYTHPRYEN